MHQTREDKYFRAKDEIKKIKNFRWFVLMVIVASIYMIGFSVFLSYNEAEDFFVPITIYLGTTFGLWIILLFEYIKIFKSDIFFIKSWEQKQIKKFVKKNQ